MTTDAHGNFAASEYGTADIKKSFKKIDENTQGIAIAIAIAIALAGITVSSSKTFALAANIGFYDDKQAFAAQGAFRTAPNWTVSGGVGFGMSDSSEAGGRVGIMTEW